MCRPRLPRFRYGTRPNVDNLIGQFINTKDSRDLLQNRHSQMLSKSLKKRIGIYRFMPLFFLLGAGIELFMIKVRVGKETFCK